MMVSVTSQKKPQKLKGGGGVKGRGLPAGREAAFFLWFIQSATGGGGRGHCGVKRSPFELTKKKELDREMGRERWWLICRG